MAKLLYPEEVYAIQGAIYAVYHELGAGFLESVYQEAMEKELTIRRIPFSRKELRLYYKNEPMSKTFKPDLLCFDLIIVELKSVTCLTNQHFAQVRNYLAATKLRLGLLVNFSHTPKVKIKRVAF